MYLILIQVIILIVVNEISFYTFVQWDNLNERLEDKEIWKQLSK